MCVCICTCTNICKYIFVCVYVFLCLCMYYIIVMYVCVHVRKWIYMYVFMYICVSLCVCLSLFHEKIPSASSFTFWSSQFHSQSHRSVFPCLSRNTKKTDEVWIFAGITVRRWLSEVTVICFSLFVIILIMLIMPTARSSLIWLELSCWLSASAFVAVWLLLEKSA